MEIFIITGIFGFFGVMFVDRAEREKKRQERIREAYKFEVQPIHGTRKFATDKELKKAGLI